MNYESFWKDGIRESRPTWLDSSVTIHIETWNYRDSWSRQNQDKLRPSSLLKTQFNCVILNPANCDTCGHEFWICKDWTPI